MMSQAFRKALDPKYGKLREQARLAVETGTAKRALTAALAFQSAYPNEPEALYEMARALAMRNA
jgi:hypothetical protein